MAHFSIELFQSGVCQHAASCLLVIVISDTLRRKVGRTLEFLAIFGVTV